MSEPTVGSTVRYKKGREVRTGIVTKVTGANLVIEGVDGYVPRKNLVEVVSVQFSGVKPPVSSGGEYTLLTVVTPMTKAGLMPPKIGPHLTAYVKQINDMAAIFRSVQTIDLSKLDASMAKDLFYRLGGDLSPENLCCDGELRGAALQRKSRMLHGAVADLKALGYVPPSDAYLP